MALTFLFSKAAFAISDKIEKALDFSNLVRCFELK